MEDVSWRSWSGDELSEGWTIWGIELGPSGAPCKSLCHMGPSPRFCLPPAGSSARHATPERPNRIHAQQRRAEHVQMPQPMGLSSEVGVVERRI